MADISSILRRPFIIGSVQNPLYRAIVFKVERYIKGVVRGGIAYKIGNLKKFDCT